MKKLVMVAMMVFLAVMVAASVNAKVSFIYDKNGNAIAASGDGFQSMKDANGRRISAYEYANGRPSGRAEYDGRGRQISYNNNRRDDRRSSYNREDYDYGDNDYNNDYRQPNRSNIQIGVKTKIGKSRVNVDYDKTTYSKPKPKPRPQRVAVVSQPADATGATSIKLVNDEDGKEIAQLDVDHPEKIAVWATIVFKKSGIVSSKCLITRISGEKVFVEVDKTKGLGLPSEDDTFKIFPA